VKLSPAPLPVAVGGLLHGYRLLKVEDLPSLDVKAWLLRHERTGAWHLHLASSQVENTFVLGFRTLPENHTGVAHILEHSVLEGSRAYPVHLFRHLTGRSLYTFLNAMTSADRTYYPFATGDATDFRNLLGCYLDACFHPLLKEETFLQEGWRLEFEDPEDPDTPLQFKGVVFNEMKAALSQPDAWFARILRRRLFPDRVYAMESGGIPAHFPELDIHGLRAFHDRHYHPSNSWCITFGNRDGAELLATLDAVFAGFEGRPPLPVAGPQPDTGGPQRITEVFPVAEGTPEAELHMAAMAWRLVDTADCGASLSLGFLFEVIAGNLSAPLNKCLLESGLGTGLAPVGYDSWGAQTWFATGLKGIPAERLPELETVILKELERLAREGIPADAVEAVLDRWEFELRNTDGGRSPWGLSLSYEVLGAWMNGAEPFELLHSDRQLEHIRRATQDPGFLPGLIRHHLLGNTGRLSLVLTPDPGGAERQQEQERAELARRTETLDSKGRQAIVDDARRVTAYRETEQDLSCLPDLDPALLPRQGMRLEVEHGTHAAGGAAAAHGPAHQWHRAPAAGLPVGSLGPELAGEDLLSLLTRFSLGGRGIEATARRIQSVTGGIGLGGLHGLDTAGTGEVHRMLLSTRCLERRLPECIELLQEVLFAADLEAPERLRELTGLIRSNLRGSVVSGAAGFAMGEALAAVSPFGRMNSLVDGLEGMQRVYALDGGGEELGRELRLQLARLLTGHAPDVALAGSAAAMERAGTLLEPLLARLMDTPVVDLPRCAGDVPPLAGELTAWITDVNGAFVAEGLPAPAYAHEDAPLLYLLAKLMDKPLYTRIRAQGGAYGATARYTPNQRAMVFGSWRDPRIQGTLEDYKRTRTDMAEGRFSDAELKEGRIAVLRQLDSPIRPGMAASEGLNAWLHKRTDDARDTFRCRVLDTGRDALMDCARRWLLPERSGARVVITSDGLLGKDLPAGLPVNRRLIFPEGGRQ
jgi:Zn-dependent M16 (insulinase) family peptidase